MFSILFPIHFSNKKKDRSCICSIDFDIGAANLPHQLAGLWVRHAVTCRIIGAAMAVRPWLYWLHPGLCPCVGSVATEINRTGERERE